MNNNNNNNNRNSNNNNNNNNNNDDDDDDDDDDNYYYFITMFSFNIKGEVPISDFRIPILVLTREGDTLDIVTLVKLGRAFPISCNREKAFLSLWGTF